MNSLRTIQVVLYLAGVFALGLFHSALKSATGGGIGFVLAAIAYLVVLRLFGIGIAKAIAFHRTGRGR